MAERPRNLTVQEFQQQLDILKSIKPLLQEYINHLETEQNLKHKKMVFNPQRFKVLYDFLGNIKMRSIRYTLKDQRAYSERLTLNIRELTLQKVKEQKDILLEIINLLTEYIDFLQGRSTVESRTILLQIVSTFNIAGLQVTIQPYLR